VAVTGFHIGDSSERGDPPLATPADLPVWAAVGRDGVIIGYQRNDYSPPPPPEIPVVLIYDESEAVIGHFGQDGLPVLLSDEG
jgi:hypothetical protein